MGTSPLISQTIENPLVDNRIHKRDSTLFSVSLLPYPIHPTIYLLPLLFYTLLNDPKVLTTSTDNADLFARDFSCNSTLDDGSQQLPDFPSRTEQKLSSKNITAKMVSRAIYDLDASKVTGSDRIPAIVLKMCSPELSIQ